MTRGSTTPAPTGLFHSRHFDQDQDSLRKLGVTLHTTIQKLLKYRTLTDLK